MFGKKLSKDREKVAITQQVGTSHLTFKSDDSICVFFIFYWEKN